MSTRMSRKEVLDSVQSNIQNEDRIRQILVTEAVMRALAKRLERTSRSGESPDFYTTSMLN